MAPWFAGNMSSMLSRSGLSPACVPCLMRRVRPLLVGTFALVQEQAPARHPAPPASASLAACDGTWSKPKALLTHEGLAVFVADPTFSTHGDSLYLVGFPTQFSDPNSGEVVRRDLIGVRYASGVAEPLALPTPTTRPWIPVGVTDSVGALHVVWAEADDTMPQLPVYKRLRYASWWRGAWSTPETVLSAESIEWDGALLKSLQFVAGEPLLLVAVRDPNGDRIDLVRRIATSHWTVVRLPTVGHTTYSGLLIRSPADLVFSYVASAWRVLGDRMSLWVTHSSDSGKMWTEAARLFVGGVATARDHNVATLATGELQAAWVLSQSGGTSDSLVVARSADGGRTWRRLTSVSAGKPFRAQLFVGRTGVVDGFTFVPGATRWETEHLRWAGGAWRGCSVPPMDSVSVSRAGSDGKRYWLAMASKRSTDGGPFVLASTLSSFSLRR